MSGEQNLWIAVIAQAFEDAKAKVIKIKKRPVKSVIRAFRKAVSTPFFSRLNNCKTKESYMKKYFLLTDVDAKKLQNKNMAKTQSAYKKRQQREAIKYLTEPNKGLFEVCGYAGLEPESVMRYARKLFVVKQ